MHDSRPANVVTRLCMTAWLRPGGHSAPPTPLSVDFAHPLPIGRPFPPSAPPCRSLADFQANAATSTRVFDAAVADLDELQEQLQQVRI